MMNRFRTAKLKHTTVLLILTGLMLLTAIAFATTKLFSSYAHIENDRAESFWSIVQLQKELDATYYNAQLHQANALQYDELRLRYELLWSRFPVVQNMLAKDEIFQQIPGLAEDIQLIFNNVRKVETPITKGKTLTQHQLDDWIQTLASDRKRMNRYIIHNMSGFNNDYVSMASDKLLKYLLLVGFLTAILILYLGFLLNLLILQQKRTRYLLAHDSLTGLKGRFYTLNAINKRCQHKHPFTLINFDLNKFKQINDNYGHHTGDQVLLHISGLFKKTLAQHGEVGRVGGDEFLWVTDIVNKEEINQLYDQLLHRLRRSFMTDNNEILQLRISAGGGLAADYNFDEDLLKDEVDKAMYQAKSSQLSEIYWQAPPSANVIKLATPQPSAKPTPAQPKKSIKHSMLQFRLF